MVQKYKESLYLLYIVDELCVSVFLGTDGIEALVDHIENQFNCIPITESG